MCLQPSIWNIVLQIPTYQTKNKKKILILILINSESAASCRGRSLVCLLQSLLCLTKKKNGKSMQYLETSSPLEMVFFCPPGLELHSSQRNFARDISLCSDNLCPSYKQPRMKVYLSFRFSGSDFSNAGRLYVNVIYQADLSVEERQSSSAKVKFSQSCA